MESPTISSGGALTVTVSQTSSGITVDFGGSLTVLSGGVVVGTAMAGAETLSGGTDSGGIIAGSQTISAGGLALGNSVDDGARQIISTGGVASGTDVGGREVVLSGGTVFDSIFEEGRQQDSSSAGGVISGGRSISGIVGSRGTLTVESGGASGGAVATFVEAGGELFLLAGGSTTGTVLAAGTSVGVGGYAFEGGGTASATVISSGAAELLEGASATGSVVLSGGLQWILGGTAFDDVTQAGGRVWDAASLIYTDAANTSAGFFGLLSGSGAIVQSGAGTLLLGGSAAGFTGVATLDTGTLELASAGAAGSAVIAFAPGAAALLRVDGPADLTNSVSGFSAGDVIDLAGLSFAGQTTPVVSGNTVTITEGTSSVTLVIAEAGADSLTLAADNQGGTQLSNATTLPFVMSGSTLTVSSGQTSAAVPVLAGGTLIVLSGGTAVSASVAGTELLSGGTDRLAEVTSGGVQTVSAGGIALGDTIDSGGKQTISSGGVVSGTLVSGYEVVLGGGIASGSIAEAYAGNLYSVVVSGGESVGAIVLSNGAMSVSGVASYTWSGEVLSITVLAPSSALATTVNAGGELDVYAGGIISGTVLLGGAKEYVEQGGMALGTTVDNGAVEHLYDSGTAVGSVIEAGGIQSVTEATAFNDVVMSGGVVSDAGTVAYTEATGITSSFVGTLTGSGALVQSGPGTLVLAGNLSGFSGTAQISGGTLDLTSAGAGGSATIDFAPATTGILRIDGTTGTANTISGFTSGDIIDLAGLGFSGAEAPTVSGDTVTVTESGLMVSLMVAGASFRTFKLSSDGSAGTDVQIACYCPGTLILTDQGEIAVEALEIGDRLVTMTGAAEPIRWIGRRSYAGRFLAGKQHLLPVVIRAGALGGRLPRRDLRVSPNHAMFINRLLVPARQLVNGVSIVQELDCRRVDYIHVELADHRVIWAEGAPSETYLDDDNRAMFHNASEFTPLDGPGVSPPRYYATRVEEGFELEAIRTRLMLLADGRAAA